MISQFLINIFYRARVSPLMSRNKILTTATNPSIHFVVEFHRQIPQFPFVFSSRNHLYSAYKFLASKNRHKFGSIINSKIKCFHLKMLTRIHGPILMLSRIHHFPLSPANSCQNEFANNTLCWMKLKMTSIHPSILNSPTNSNSHHPSIHSSVIKLAVIVKSICSIRGGRITQWWGRICSG